MIFTLDFGINGFMNYMSYANKVDLLTIELSRLTNIVDDMNKKIDDYNNKYFDLEHRLTILETEAGEKKRGNRYYVIQVRLKENRQA
jgi:hypothetical protein